MPLDCRIDLPGPFGTARGIHLAGRIQRRRIGPGARPRARGTAHAFFFLLMDRLPRFCRQMLKVELESDI